MEFDPVTAKQRIVVDAHKVCKLNAKGYAAQAKFHTRNYVGPSGIIKAAAYESLNVETLHRLK